MKTYKKYLIGVIVLTSLSVSGCKKEYFNRPPSDAITLDNFYQTNDQVIASTNVLYSAPWFGYCGKGGWAITELAGGNGRSGSSDVAGFGTFSVQNTDFELSGVWNSLFIVVAQANGIINNLPAKAPASVDADLIKNALGEAHLFRALAYFHLVRIFGDVPIIENSADYIDDFKVNTNPVADVYKFITNDLLFAETNCRTAIRGSSYAGNARVSSGSASALLAKVYLYQKDYANARIEAEKVINSGEFKMFGSDIQGKTFSDLFLTANNNNEESIIQLQWSGNGGYGRGNLQQASFAYSGIITGTGDGYGVLAPSFSLIDAYQDGDLRVHGTIMYPGDFYPEINQAAGGYTLPDNANSQGTHAQVKKYVVGTPADNGGSGGAQSAANNTYMMRYSEIFLIEAEAVMAGAETSTDAVALAAINKVRNRAGLGDLTVINRNYTIPNPNLSKYGANSVNAPATLIKDDILDERRREFAFENDYFFDLGRLDRTKAIAIIKQQDRGGSDNSTPPIRYGDIFRTVTANDFLYPYPATEVAINPKLTEAPVPYVFK